MRIALCATRDTISHVWKDSLKPTGHKRKIVQNEEELLQYLSKHNKSVNLVCLEDIWVGEKLSELEELIVALREWYPHLHVMVLSQYPTFSLGRSLLNLGIKGYGNARMLPIHLQDAFDCIQRGDVWVYPEFVQMMIQGINSQNNQISPDTDDLQNLSPREKEITQLIYKGHTNKEIAQMTDITLRTVKAHTASIYEKLNVKDRVALVLMLKSKNV